MPVPEYALPTSLGDVLCRKFYPGFYVVVLNEQVLTKERVDFYLSRAYIDVISYDNRINYKKQLNNWVLIQDTKNIKCVCGSGDPAMHGILIIETDAWVGVFAQRKEILEDILSMSLIISGSVDSFFKLFKNATLISMDIQ